MLGTVGSAFASALIKPILESNTTSKDFFLFTIFTTSVAGEKVTSVGILKHFLIIKADGKLSVL
ncbi:hypothetical protein D3C86_2093130 [compost metagenome]